MDGLVKSKERVFLLAASNLPWDLDMAMLRRLEKRVLIFNKDFSNFTRIRSETKYDLKADSKWR